MTALFGTFLGYIFHYSFHQKWMGPFYKAHLTHHTLYTYEDYTALTYRDSGKDNTVWMFSICFSPFFISPILFWWLGILSLSYAATIFITMVFIGWINNSLHDNFHMQSTWWSMFSFFPKLKWMHRLHHLNVQRNFGIFSFVWDRIFGTYIRDIYNISK
jgi:sterol desaturase/sphingolipid hydroxylase (fatty acid hydroxylase superfamily)